MFCYLSKCENKTLARDQEVTDCVHYHYKVAMTLIHDELKKIKEHYNAMKTKFLDNEKKLSEEKKKLFEESRARKRFERKFNEEKNKNEKLSTETKIWNSKETSSKRVSSKPLNSLIAQEDDDPMFVFSTSAAKSKSPVKPGKENSPVKRPKTNAWLIKPAAPSTKVLKQSKIVFFAKPPEAKNSKKRIAQSVDSDMTYCEELEKAKEASLFESKVKSKLNTSMTMKRKLPQRKSIEESGTTSKIINVPLRQSSSPVQILKRKASDGNVDVPKQAIKEEPLSDQVAFESDFDIFLDNVLSSILIVEPDKDADKPISVHGSFTEQTDQSMDDQTLVGNPFLDYSEPSTPIAESLPVRRRRIFYGDCSDCREFYDRYAEINGPTQADEHIRQCPKKCKGNNLRKSKAEPPPPVVEYNRPNGDNTPEGFWNLDFTPQPN